MLQENTLLPVDRLEILILIDNATDNLSSTPKFVEMELLRLAARPDALLTGEAICHACHGFSCMPNIPIHAIFGGLHLVGANEPIIPQTVEAIGGFAPQVIASGHCTGWRALTQLAAAFGDQRVCPSAVGKRYTLA